MEKLPATLLTLLLLLTQACSGRDLIPPTASAKELGTLDKIDSISKVLGCKVYKRWCSHCHDAGNEHPGTMALLQLRGEDKSVLLERSDLTKAYISIIVSQGLMMMPPFRPTEITNDELEALTTYITNAALQNGGEG